jgi:adenylate cyclase
MNSNPPTLGSAERRRLAAIVFTDVDGYSARVQRDETGTLELVRIDFERIRSLTADHGGEVLKSMGDGLLLCFPSVVDAVACALEAQKEFAARPAEALQHRIGIHLGDVFRVDGDVTGDGVNIAARLQTKARLGTICLSQSVYDAVKGKLEMQVESLGRQQFKNITEPIAIYLAAPLGIPLTRRANRTSFKWISLMTALAAGLAVYFLLTRHSVKPPQESSAAPKPAVVSERSIAVLPFANLSPDPANTYFAEGVHEDVITSLAKIHDLRVISRMAVMEYRTGERDLRSIGRDLGVANILEGSVRRWGDTVRVTAQLVDAQSGESLWADSYDGDVRDALHVQAQFAKNIASALQANLTSEERELIDRPPTMDADAYDLYLKARATYETLGKYGRLDQYSGVLALLQQAVAKDPRFCLAYVEMVMVHATLYSISALDPTPERLAMAIAAAKAATDISPDLPETKMALGIVAYTADRNWTRALDLFSAAAVGLPNDDQLYYWIGDTQRRLGRWPEAIYAYRQSLVLNPRSVACTIALVQTLRWMRRPSEASVLAEKLHSVIPNDRGLALAMAMLRYEQSGNRAQYLNELDALPPAANDPFRLADRFFSAFRRKDWNAADAVLADPRLQRLTEVHGGIDDPIAFYKAMVAAIRGRKEEARSFANQAIAIYRAGSWSPAQRPWVLMRTAEAEGFAGRALEAERDAEASWQEVADKDATEAIYFRSLLAEVYIVTGNTEKALSTLGQMMKNPSDWAPMEIANELFWVDLKDDPRFHQILASATSL